jgi:hypothetical protein
VHSNGIALPKQFSITSHLSFVVPDSFVRQIKAERENKLCSDTTNTTTTITTTTTTSTKTKRTHHPYLSLPT